MARVREEGGRLERRDALSRRGRKVSSGADPGRPGPGDQGRIVHWAGINLDIGRLKETEAELQRQAEELRRSNRDLEQFAFVASHDIQEPLRTVNIYTRLLLRKTENRSPELDQFAGFVREGVLRMESLIRDLLEYSRVLQTELDQQPVDSGRIVQRAIKLCQTSVQEPGAEIEAGSLPTVCAGEPHVLQKAQSLKFNIATRLKISPGEFVDYFRAEQRAGRLDVGSASDVAWGTLINATHVPMRSDVTVADFESAEIAGDTIAAFLRMKRAHVTDDMRISPEDLAWTLLRWTLQERRDYAKVLKRAADIADHGGASSLQAAYEQALQEFAKKGYSPKAIPSTVNRRSQGRQK